MESSLVLLLNHPLRPPHFHHSLTAIAIKGKEPLKSNALLKPFQCSLPSASDAIIQEKLSLQCEGRRELMGFLVAFATGLLFCDVAGAASTSRRALRGAKVPESEFTALPNGLKYYDLKIGGGAEAVKGSRVAVWCTMLLNGRPYGFDVGQSERGTVLKGLDLGVQGMRVGGQRLLIVPPELAYGNKGIQEIPPNATIELDVELLSIKQSPFGSPVKVIEG